MRRSGKILKPGGLTWALLILVLPGVMAAGPSLHSSPPTGHERGSEITFESVRRQLEFGRYAEAEAAARKLIARS